ncbi:MAG: tannase/feruloyl esterase family alpha/beta hydrolase [Rhodospirillaceae bacterium]|nr:tannase/feruloyl esterase family alpha/beta hydrolase [Rhodospirillaceae bacterium]
MRNIILTTALVAFALNAPARADEAACKSITQLDLAALPDAPTHITYTVFVPASEKLPAYCDVRGYVAPQVGIRLRIPDKAWNGKFHFEGCGTMCGVRTIEAANDPLSRGYAVAVTDTGHSAPHPDDDLSDETVNLVSRSGEWAYNNIEGELDLAYRGTHKAVLASKAIVEAYTGTAPRKSYWRGCSTGGRQALNIAQRYPWQFDGIIAGAPAGVQPAYINIFWRTLANMDKDGRAIMGREHLAALNKAVVAQCDAKDGLADGVINDPWSCTPDLSVLKCKAGQDASQCLNANQIAAAERIYRGAFLKNGLRVTPGVQPGAEMNWAPYIRDKAGANVTFEPMAQDRLRYVWFDYDPGPTYSPRSFDLDRDYPRLFTKGQLQAPSNPDLADFQRRGGKLIVYQGLNDLLDAGPLVDYVEKASRVAGGKTEADKFMKLYLIPGMDHCRGGVGVDTVDWISAMENWVEKNETPGTLIAARRSDAIGHPGAKGFPLDPAKITKTRPIYPFPDVAAYTGSGDPAKAENFKPAPLSYVPLAEMSQPQK